MKTSSTFLAGILFTIGFTSRIAVAETGTAPPHVLNVPSGFTIELVAGAPLTERPIVASFDDEGRLYVAESSGSNDPVDKQLAERPHRIARLEDTDEDGKFDKRTVFADGMMFPEGAMFFDGSLYVSAPPSIWKLTDTNGDGVADERVEWFQGRTLTGCANDLHGPYAGPDGWIYWCKGAFAEQIHMVNGHEWKTRAAHIFRCRPDGTGFEPVMTGGMDNPVDVVFTTVGEPILSATFLVGDGRRDGLVHAAYGAVFGKEHGVLDGHPRTGELMPAIVYLGAGAPCGLERYDSPSFGADYRDNLFCTQFNLRKVSRHVLQPAGSTFASVDSDFVWSDNVDFHPTDVLVDADGSLLVLDTGGWYKLCCPTSQLWKPDVLGGIYRVRRDGATPPADPRGRKIAWATQTADQLWALLADVRPAVRQRATRELVQRRDTEEFGKSLRNWAAGDALTVTTGESSCDARTAALARAWAIVQFDTAESRSLIRGLLSHPDEHIRHIALHAVSLHRDTEAASQLVQILAHDSSANRRAAAETLGRLGQKSAIPNLLAAAATADDRFLQHSVTYALIELAEPTATQKGLASTKPGTVASCLIALDQMQEGGIQSAQVIPHLNAQDERLRHAALWLVTQHAEWDGELAQWFREQLASLPDNGDAVAPSDSESSLEQMLVRFAAHEKTQELLSDIVTDLHQSATARHLALRVMGRVKLHKPPQSWYAAIAGVIATADPNILPLAVSAARELPPDPALSPPLNQSLLAVADAEQNPPELRTAALAGISATLPEISEQQFQLLASSLSAENTVSLRSAAADAISRAHLSPSQLDRLGDSLQSASPLELNRLLTPFKQSAEEHAGLKLLASLKGASALPSLRIDLLRELLAGYSPTVQSGIDELQSLVNVDAGAQRARIEELLPQMEQGDVRRGHAVFYGAKAACSACHRLGYAGGSVGPELTKIGEIRTKRDLLESILFPSLSFVRSYEPVLIITTDGLTINGVIRDETAQDYVVATGPDKEVRVRREDVEDIQPSTVSVMPAGLDKQLSTQDLADLVAFLKNATGH